MSSVYNQGSTLFLSDALVLTNLSEVDQTVRLLFSEHPSAQWQVNLDTLERLDTAGALFLHELSALANQHESSLQLGPLPEHLQSIFHFATPLPAAAGPTPALIPFLERFGASAFRFIERAADFLYLMADLSYFSVQALWNRRAIRRDAFVDQAYAIGAQALPIIGLILFLIGAVSALQSAAQLRQFGADIYVADLLAIGITTELGPLMTAIMVAGRSGSAIAAEIATMKFSEELDALRTMALEPLRYVAVPKMWAMVATVPLLTVMADFVGILGGTVIGVFSMGISPAAFVTQILSSLFLKDILTGLIKSAFFAWIITVIAVYRGVNFSGGAVGVGQAITSAVVSSLVGIIILDLALNLLFY